MLWFLAIGAKSNQRKMRRYSGFSKATSVPGHGREIGGGGFLVNVTCGFTGSLSGDAILSLPIAADSASVRARFRA
jgi:hypothetical protein